MRPHSLWGSGKRGQKREGGRHAKKTPGTVGGNNKKKVKQNELGGTGTSATGKPWGWIKRRGKIEGLIKEDFGRKRKC